MLPLEDNTKGRQVVQSRAGAWPSSSAESADIIGNDVAFPVLASKASLHERFLLAGLSPDTCLWLALAKAAMIDSC